MRVVFLLSPPIVDMVAYACCNVPHLPVNMVNPEGIPVLYKSSFGRENLRCIIWPGTCVIQILLLLLT